MKILSICETTSAAAFTASWQRRLLVESLQPQSEDDIITTVCLCAAPLKEGGGLQILHEHHDTNGGITLFPLTVAKSCIRDEMLVRSRFRFTEGEVFLRWGWSVWLVFKGAHMQFIQGDVGSLKVTVTCPRCETVALSPTSA